MSNSIQNIVFSQEQEKIRKHWLWSLLTMTLLFPLVLFLLAAFFLRENFFSTPEVTHPLLLSLFLGFLQAALFVRFAYYNSGTKLLTFWLWVSPLSYLRDTIHIFEESSEGEEIFLAIILTGLYIWLYYQNLQLRKVNRSIQTQLKAIKPLVF